MPSGQSETVRVYKKPFDLRLIGLRYIACWQTYRMQRDRSHKVKCHAIKVEIRRKMRQKLIKTSAMKRKGRRLLSEKKWMTQNLIYSDMKAFRKHTAKCAIEDALEINSYAEWLWGMTTERDSADQRIVWYQNFLLRSVTNTHNLHSTYSGQQKRTVTDTPLYMWNISSKDCTLWRPVQDETKP